MNRSRSYLAVPPGATIKEQLEYRGMSQKEFAARMDCSEKHISRLINGEVQLTTDMAVKLELVLGVSAEFWSRLEASYRETLVKVDAENHMDADLEMLKSIPYHQMAEFGWVPECKDRKERVRNLRSYFEVVRLPLLENAQISRIACRRLAVTEKSDLALMAWVQKAKLEARNVQTGVIDIKGLIRDIPQLRGMTKQRPEEFCDTLKDMLAKRGIALVFLPHLQGSFLQGATFMDGSKIVIGLTARGRDADRFWFSLFHELGHVVSGHVGQSGGTDEEDEKTADQWASDALIPERDLKSFVFVRNFSENSVCAFAQRLGIAPGIVVGRLQNDGVIRHNVLNALKEQYEITA